jgi:uncharacterized protein (DUF58 family)
LLSNGRDAVDRIRQEGWQHDHRTRLAAREKVEMRDSSARLEPLVVQTRRGMEQFQRIRETLARVELTDGLTTAELIVEVASRIPRDATVVAVLPDASVETALALGTLRRQGFAVSAVLITLGPEQLEKSYGRLLAEGITDVRHLVSQEGLPELCRQQVRKATPYLLETDLT